MTDELVILNKPEEERLIHALLSAQHVRKMSQFFLWTQGQLQGVLAHKILVCIQFGDDEKVLRVECLRSTVPDAESTRLLCDPIDGLAVRIARYCRSGQLLPAVIERGPRDAEHPLSRFETEVLALELRNAIVHGTGRLCGAETVFALFSLPTAPTARHTFFLELLLPSLHLTFLRVATQTTSRLDGPSDPKSRRLTAREAEILQWVARGKRNHEIGVQLELSALTVKNHVQKIYRKLGVNNRAQAISRGHELQLLDLHTRSR